MEQTDFLYADKNLGKLKVDSMMGVIKSDHGFLDHEVINWTGSLNVVAIFGYTDILLYLLLNRSTKK